VIYVVQGRTGWFPTSTFGANLLIREQGADAELEAARLADLMLDRGDDWYGHGSGARSRRYNPRHRASSIEVTAGANKMIIAVGRGYQALDSIR
jgi:hypothetical protein